MLTNDEIKQIVDAHKEVFATKTDLADFRDEMRGNYSGLLTSIDIYSGKADKYFQEMLMLSHKVDRLDRWIHEIAEKVGLQLRS